MTRWLVLLLLLFAASLSACDRSDAPTQKPGEERDAGEERAIPVQVSSVEAGEVTRSITATTTLIPETSVRVVAEVSGTVTEWGADNGDAVTRGSLLAVTRVPELDVQIREARLNLARANREVTSVGPLHESGYVSEQVWEEAQYQRDAARAALDRLQEQAGRQRINSPIDGVVLAREIERGETVAAGALLFQVADLSELVADIAVPERELSSVREGMSARLEIPASSADRIEGRVTRIAPAIDQATGTATVRVQIDGESDAMLRPGMFTTVRIPTETRSDVPTVPARAIIEEGESRSVFVVVGSEELTVERREIDLGLRDGDVQEVTSGVTVGDRVVTIGQSRLRDGARVLVSSDPTASAGGT